jgi:NAD(P)-dependent dehydrogenase (short-subunit alcohol dehydrogenase family)
MDTFRPISHAAVNALARLAARRAVNAELRGQGVRVTLVKPATINAKATEWLAQHPEAYEQAHDIAVRFKMYDKRRPKLPELER